MTRISGIVAVSFLIVALSVAAQDWTKESKDRTKRAALHAAAQLVRGDTGKWNDDARLQHAPPLAQKPPKLTFDAWADQLLKKKVELTDKDDNWLIFRSEQLDDNDRVWVERIERRGQQITVIANQAKADLQVAQAQAEKRRAAAVAQEQEMKARVEENRAKVVLAEAEVPLAISQAFRDGRLGVLEYYGLRNLQSDTEMRNSIAGTSRQDGGPNRVG